MGPLHVDKSTFRWIAISLAAVASLALVALGVQIGSGILSLGGQQAPTNAGQRSAAVVDASETAPPPAPVGTAVFADAEETIGPGVASASPGASGAPAGDEAPPGPSAPPEGGSDTPAPAPSPPGPVPEPPPTGPTLDPLLAPLEPVLEPLPLGSDAITTDAEPSLLDRVVAVLGL